MTNKTTAVATKEQAQVPAAYAGYEEYAGQGLEDLDSSDRSVPFIKVLEKNSPEIETVPGAKPGMFINTATQQLYESIRFVPAVRDHMFVEWVPIDNGGGLVASYGILEPISKWAKSQRGKIKLKNGNDLVETFYLYGILVPEDDSDEEPQPVVISFTSTRIRAYKSITNRSDSIIIRLPNGRKIKAPWFSHVWRITSEKKVDGNQSWYVYNAQFDGPDAESVRLLPEDPIFQMGAEMVRQKSEGGLTINEAAAGEQPDLPARDSGDSGSSRSAGMDDDPPF